MKNVTPKSLIKPSKVFPSTMHIKMELMKNFVKALDVKDPAFTCVCGKFPRLTFEKVFKSRCVYWSSNQTTF